MKWMCLKCLGQAIKIFNIYSLQWMLPKGLLCWILQLKSFTQKQPWTRIKSSPLVPKRSNNRLKIEANADIIIQYTAISGSNVLRCLHHEATTERAELRPRPRPKPSGTLSVLDFPWLLWLQWEEWRWPWCEFVLFEFTLIATWPLPLAWCIWPSPFCKFEFLDICIIPIPSVPAESSTHSTSSLKPLIKKSEQFLLHPWS